MNTGDWSSQCKRLNSSAGLNLSTQANTQGGVAAAWRSLSKEKQGSVSVTGNKSGSLYTDIQ